MGSWGITAFQSDAGLDFLGNMAEKSNTKDGIEKALGGVICFSSFCSETEALAEIIANAYGKMKCDEKSVSKLEMSSAMKYVKNLEADKAYFENTLAKLHYALNIINKFNGVVWKEELLEERKLYIAELSNAIEEIIREIKEDGTDS